MSLIEKEKMHSSVLLGPAKERRTGCKARIRAAQLPVVDLKTREAFARAESEEEGERQRTTIYLPPSGDAAPAAARTPVRFHLPRHQDASATLAGAHPFRAKGGFGSHGAFVGPRRSGMLTCRRAVALYHLDCPWRPLDIAEREGRLLHQGSQNPEVAIIRFATERSFDLYMWLGVEPKAIFMAQLMRGRLDTRARAVADAERATSDTLSGGSWNIDRRVELRGFEPLASSMPWKRATNCAIAPSSPGTCPGPAKITAEPGVSQTLCGASGELRGQGSGLHQQCGDLASEGVGEHHHRVVSWLVEPHRALNGLACPHKTGLQGAGGSQIGLLELVGRHVVQAEERESEGAGRQLDPGRDGHAGGVPGGTHDGPRAFELVRMQPDAARGADGDIRCRPVGRRWRR